jgi:hypothetical protein
MGVTYDPAAISKGIAGIGRSLEDDFGSNIPNTLKLLTEKETKFAPGPPHPALDPRPAPLGKAPVDLDELQTLRKQLGRPNTDPTEGLAARQAQGQLDDLLAGIDSRHVLSGDAAAATAKLGEARDYWSAMKRAEIVGGRLDLGDLNLHKGGTGTNVNADRQAIGALVRPNMKGEIPAKKFGFNEPEIAQANKVARGEWWDNALRKVGGGVFGHGVVGGIGLTEYMRTGDPEWLVPYATTSGLRGISRGITKSRLRGLDEMVRSRSPAGPFKYNVTAPPERLKTGYTGALLGLPAVQRQLLDNED